MHTYANEWQLIDSKINSLNELFVYTYTNHWYALEQHECEYECGCACNYPNVVSRYAFQQQCICLLFSCKMHRKISIEFYECVCTWCWLFRMVAVNGCSVYVFHKFSIELISVVACMLNEQMPLNATPNRHHIASRTKIILFNGYIAYSRCVISNADTYNPLHAPHTILLLER